MQRQKGKTSSRYAGGNDFQLIVTLIIPAMLPVDL